MKRRALLMVPIFALAVSACSGGNVFSLEAGQCFDDPDNFEEVSNVPIVECSEPHHNEVYDVFELPDGAYPGIISVEMTAEDACLAGFEPFVGLDYASSQWDIGYLYPTPDTWENGDREVVCMVYDLSGQRTSGTAGGSAR